MTAPKVERRDLSDHYFYDGNHIHCYGGENPEPGWRIVAERDVPEDSEAEKLARELEGYHENDYEACRERSNRAAAWIRAHDPEKRT